MNLGLATLLRVFIGLVEWGLHLGADGLHEQARLVDVAGSACCLARLGADMSRVLASAAKHLLRYRVFGQTLGNRFLGDDSRDNLAFELLLCHVVFRRGWLSDQIAKVWFSALGLNLEVVCADLARPLARLEGGSLDTGGTLARLKLASLPVAACRLVVRTQADPIVTVLILHQS